MRGDVWAQYKAIKILQLSMKVGIINQILPCRIICMVRKRFGFVKKSRSNLETSVHWCKVKNLHARYLADINQSNRIIINQTVQSESKLLDKIRFTNPNCEVICNELLLQKRYSFISGPYDNFLVSIKVLGYMCIVYLGNKD